MKRKIFLMWSLLLMLCLGFSLAFDAFAAQQVEQKPIILKTMGSLFFGETVATNENGVTFHGDHGYAQYYIPQNSRNLPLIMWHGIGQSGKTYESTPDGREGYQAILIPFADLNNIQVADQLEAWLKDKKLDGKDVPHQGPQKRHMELTIPLGM